MSVQLQSHVEREHNRTCDPNPFTQRELQIARAVALGCTNSDIARQLVTSEEAIKQALGEMFDKLDVTSRLELVLCAIHRQLLTQVHGRDKAN